MNTAKDQPAPPVGMSRREVAEYLHLSPERVRQLTVAGRLTYTDTPLGRLYHRVSVEALAESRRTEPGVGTSSLHNT